MSRGKVVYLVLEAYPALLAEGRRDMEDLDQDAHELKLVVGPALLPSKIFHAVLKQAAVVVPHNLQLMLASHLTGGGTRGIWMPQRRTQ